MFAGDNYSGAGCHSRVAPSLRAAIPVPLCGRFLPQQRLHQWSASSKQSMQLSASDTRSGDGCGALCQAQDSAIEPEHCQMLSHEIMHIITHQIRYPTECRQENKPLSGLISQNIHTGMSTKLRRLLPISCVPQERRQWLVQSQAFDVDDCRLWPPLEFSSTWRWHAGGVMRW